MNVLPCEILNLIKINIEESNNYCVKLFEVYEDKEFVHLVLEYCHGETLRNHLQSITQDDSFDDLPEEDE